MYDPTWNPMFNWTNGPAPSAAPQMPQTIQGFGGGMGSGYGPPGQMGPTQGQQGKGGMPGGGMGGAMPGRGANITAPQTPGKGGMPDGGYGQGPSEMAGGKGGMPGGAMGGMGKQKQRPSDMKGVQRPGGGGGYNPFMFGSSPHVNVPDLYGAQQRDVQGGMLWGGPSQGGILPSQINPDDLLRLAGNQPQSTQKPARPGYGGGGGNVSSFIRL